MTYEKPQKKNPHGIIVNQHIFPARSIERFANSKGTVDVKLIKQNKIIKLPPSDPLFCAKRRWDQRAETGYMKTIEDSFQSLASSIINVRVTSLEDMDCRIATDFFALWSLRHFRNENPIQDVQLKGIMSGKSLSKDDKERLEKNHALFVEGDMDALVPGRFMTGLNIQINIDRMRSQIGKLRWGIVRSIEGEFIVPESFSTHAIIPISPTVILLGDSTNLLIPRSEVAKVNKLAVSHCRNYYFARNLQNCPL